MKNEKRKNIITLLKTLSKTKPDNISEILDFLTDGAIDNICECVFNVIYTDLKLKKGKKIKLKNHLKSNCSVHKLKTVASKKVPISKRRKALAQVGKGLPMILATAIPFLADLIFGKK